MSFKGSNNRDLVYLSYFFPLGVYVVMKGIYSYKVRKAKTTGSDVTEYQRSTIFSGPHIDSYQIVLFIYLFLDYLIEQQCGNREFNDLFTWFNSDLTSFGPHFCKPYLTLSSLLKLHCILVSRTSNLYYLQFSQCSCFLFRKIFAFQVEKFIMPYSCISFESNYFLWK